MTLTLAVNQREAVAAVLSVVRNVSAPYGISINHQPNLSMTRWRIVADHKDKLYYFESVISPSVFWVDLKAADFAAGSGVRRLDLGLDGVNIYSGEASGRFRPAESFVFERAD